MAGWRGRRVVMAAAGCVVVLAAALVVVAAPRVSRPSTVGLVVAVRELGPFSGWRCAQPAAYTYDPRRGRPDTTLLAEAPEDVLANHDPPLEVERVEADLHGGDTVIWSRIGVRPASAATTGTGTDATTRRGADATTGTGTSAADGTEGTTSTGTEGTTGTGTDVTDGANGAEATDATDATDTREQRVYVLSPGRLQAVASGLQTICNAHLADWHIVAEHALG